MPAKYDSFPTIQPTGVDWNQYNDGQVWMFTEADGIIDLDRFASVAQRWATLNRVGLEARMYAPIMKGETQRLLIRFIAPPKHLEYIGCPVWSRCPECFPTASLKVKPRRRRRP